jgi:membrane-bound metal-dependent hydrolase YbcI (DUF457 family)
MQDVVSSGTKKGRGLFAVGHFSLGYLLGKASSEILEVSVSIPLILTLSIIPDVDILFKPLIEHRGATHSVIVLFIIFLPFLAVYRKRAVPYFLSIVSHPLIGDFFIGGNIKLLWPLSNESFGLSISITSPTNMALEWLLFAVCLALMMKARDMCWFLQPHVSNLLLFIPVFTVLLPTVLSIPLVVPVWLEPPHLVFMALFGAALAIALFGLFQKMSTKLGTACTRGDP